MTDTDLNSAIDVCLSLVRDEGLGLEECLARFPEHRDELQALLPAMIRLSKAQSMRAPASLKASIARRVANQPQAKTGLIPAFVVTNLAALRSIGRNRNAAQQRRAWMIPAIVTFFVVAVISMTGLVAGADAAGPGDLLFGLDTAIEDVRLRFAQDDEKEAELRVEFASERLRELEIEIEGEGDPQDIELALLELEEAIAALEALIGEMTPEQRAAFEEALAMLIAASPNLTEFEFELEIEDGQGKIELEFETEGDEGSEGDHDEDCDSSDPGGIDCADDDPEDDDVEHGDDDCDSSGSGSSDCVDDNDDECDSSGSGSCEHDGEHDEDEHDEDEHDEHDEDEHDEEEHDEEDDD